jgi:solute:Na+ symporter, SSS family
MQLTTLDWVVIAIYFAVNLGIGFYYYRKASGSVGEFFVSGRSVPWWLAGTSMVATTFGADTPLVVTGFIYTYGIAGNWLWWSFALSGMLTVFFFARLWRRAGVITDMEFAEIRYSGKPAAFLRGFRALYLGLIINTIIMGWVNLAMVKILEITLGVSHLQAIGITLGIAAFIMVYTGASGLWSILWTDVVQFVLKMSVVTALAVYAVQAVGGMDSLKSKIEAHDAALANGTNTLAFVPDWTSGWFIMFLVFISLNWWASWYPGAEPGGGGYIAQRIFSAKNEKHSLGATLWFNIAHYAIRPWPWILTALVALLLFPNPVNPTTGKFDPEFGYMLVMIEHLPPYLRGLMLAGFAAAYMSTMATHINLGASYLMNDFYRRFVNKTSSEGHYVTASRLTTVFVTLLAAIVSFYMESIGGAWKFLLSIGAGAGLVFMLRWFWWRINAWSEISAMIAAGLCSSILQTKAGLPIVSLLHGFDPKLPLQAMDAGDPHGFAWLMIITTGFTTIVWLVVTMFTQPEPMEKLKSFYDKVRPSAFGWGPIAREAGFESKQSLLWATADWIAGCALIYFSLFGIGRLIFGPAMTGVLYLVGAALCVAFLYWDLNRRGWETLVE